MLSPATLPALQSAIQRAGLDGWLLFDFHGANPIAAGLLQLEGMVTRRVFAFVPATGAPVAVTHAIEQGAWRRWPSAWRRESYSSWRTLDEQLAQLVRGKRVAMEYSPGDAVPYLDRVPAGVLEMVRAAGAEVVSSAELVTRFYAVWTPEELASHRRAAEVVAGVAHEAMRHAGARAASADPVDEYTLQQWILRRFADEGLETAEPPIVAVGPNAADPHYEPTPDRARPVRKGDVLLIDLWARENPGAGSRESGVGLSNTSPTPDSTRPPAAGTRPTPGSLTPGPYADQTWMASLGTPGAEAQSVWGAVRDARDAAIALLRERIAAGAPVRGGEVDDAARAVIVERGYGPYFTHRTGHSIDARDLHGAGPHIDNLETREERLLVPGVGFSIEPGVYLPGRVGMRSEVNAFVGDGELIVTPAEYQRDLLLV
jgi:Xaa-Pro dipeptidase